MKKLYSLLLIVLPLLASAQYEHMWVDDVTHWGNDHEGISFDTVVFEVKPNGLYAEIGVYFDFSTRGTPYSQGDSVEIEMLFKLPKNAEVIDMWLWVYDSIVKAGMYDRWTANQIYEDIVDRRTDPAIFYRYEIYDYVWNGNTGYYDYIYYDDYYMFKIFPLMTDLPRKTKLTYLVPISQMNSSLPNIPLPANILRLSESNIQACKIKYFPSPEYGAPGLLENSSQAFTQVNGHYETTIQNAQNASSLTLTFGNNNNNDYFVGTHNDIPHNERFYQFQVSPEELFGVYKNKKAVVLFDYIDASSSMAASEVIGEFKTTLLSRFDDNDSINIMFSGMVTNSMSSGWMLADSTNITNLFNTIDVSYFNTFSNLPTLLYDGINFIKDNGNEGSIVLISSSNENGNASQANSLLSDVAYLIDTLHIPIHIIDLDDVYQSGENHNIGNQYYRGNEYLYINLAATTGGEYLSLYDQTYELMLEDVSGKLSGYFIGLDLYITLESGYTYANYRLNQTSGFSYFDQPLTQLGKYIGTGRFHVIATGQLSTGDLYHNEFFIENQDVYDLNETARNIWVGQLIRSMYNYPQSNAVITQIVDLSILERVLSNYTAFLALEPGQGPLPAQNDNPNQPPTSIDETEDADAASLISYPNPFSDITAISYNMPHQAHVLIEVYDMFGKKIATLVDSEQQAGKYTLDFSADNLAAGTYVCRMLIDDAEVLTTKLNVIR